MENVEVFLIGLFVAVAAMTSLARAISVPYPIVLVVAGLLRVPPGRAGRPAAARPRARHLPAASTCSTAARARERPLGARPRVIAWAGMRGAVSLAAALAILLETDAGAPFPLRDLILLLVFAVIFTTLELQGLTLPMLIRRLRVQEDGAEQQREELQARVAAADAALAELERLADEEWTRPDTIEHLRGLFGYRRCRFAARDGSGHDDGYEERSLACQPTIQAVTAAQRRSLIQLRSEETISDQVMLTVEPELDLEVSWLEI